MTPNWLITNVTNYGCMIDLSGQFDGEKTEILGPRGISSSSLIIQLNAWECSFLGGGIGPQNIAEWPDRGIQMAWSFDERLNCWVFQFNQPLPAGTKFVVEMF